MDLEVDIRPYGDRAFLIQVGQGIDEAISAKVSQYYHGLLRARIDHIQALIPAYDSITVLFDLRTSDPKALLLRIEKTLSSVEAGAPTQQKTLTVPVCYDDHFGIDLELLEQELSLTKEDIITTHLSRSYRVYMIGFLPGFPYLGKTDDRLYCSRLDNPRTQVWKGSVALAGNQTGIYPSTAPGGWKIIGRTPLPMFDAKSNVPSTLVTGDSVQFQRVDREEYEIIASDLERGSYQLNWDE